LQKPIRFGGPVVQLCTLGVGLVGLAAPWFWTQVWYGLVLIGAGWVAAVLWTFRLDYTPTGLCRRVAGWTLTIAWADITFAGIRPVPGFGRIRFVLRDQAQRQISFPLFLMAQPERQRLAHWLTSHLPRAVPWDEAALFQKS